MPAGNNQRLNYFSVSYGKIRRKVDPSTPGAILREIKDKNDVVTGTIYEHVFDYYEGVIHEIKFRQDEKFGNSWQIMFREPDGSVSAIQLPENSAAGRDFMKKFPFMTFGKSYRLTPYEFTDKETLKKKSGMSVYVDGDKEKKLFSFYHDYEEKPDGSKETVLLHGFPKYQGVVDSKGRADKDDLKKYFIDVAKFLRIKSLEHLAGKWNDGLGAPPEIHAGDDPDDLGDPIDSNKEKDDLPF